jgi:hypothetical protein
VTLGAAAAEAAKYYILQQQDMGDQFCNLVPEEDSTATRDYADARSIDWRMMQRDV